MRNRPQGRKWEQEAVTEAVEDLAPAWVCFPLKGTGMGAGQGQEEQPPEVGAAAGEGSGLCTDPHPHQGLQGTGRAAVTHLTGDKCSAERRLGRPRGARGLGGKWTEQPSPAQLKESETETERTLAALSAHLQTPEGRPGTLVLLCAQLRPERAASPARDPTSSRKGKQGQR